MRHPSFKANLARGTLCAVAFGLALGRAPLVHAQYAPAPPVAATAPTLRVDLHSAAESTSGLVVQALGPGAEGFHTVCVYPCGVDLSAGDTYRIAGQSVRPSSVFHLDPSMFAQRVTLDVSPVTEARHTTKWALTLGGAALAATGALLAFTGGFTYGAHSYGPNDSPNGVSGNDAPGWAAPVAMTGLIAGAIGLTALLVGTSMDDATTVTLPGR